VRIEVKLGLMAQKRGILVASNLLSFKCHKRLAHMRVERIEYLV
jgi:hypothetical protein